MKKALLMCGTLLAMTAPIAGAGPGVNLRWNACFGDGGATNRNFACNTNAGTNSLRGSFELGYDVLGQSSVAAVVDLATASQVLPEWWEFRNVGSCRQFALSIAAFDGVNCIDWALGQASMNIVAYNVHSWPNTARITVLNAINVAVSDLVAGQEYTAFALNISNAGTVGTTCTGCTVPACIVFNSIRIDTADLTSTFLSGPANQADSHYATWQGGAGVSVPGRPDACPTFSPTTRSTWSQVKSLYR